MPAEEAASPAALATLAALAGAEPVLARLMIVVAHPDDETIALGGQMRRLRDAVLVHVTDGAPRDGEDARRLGFAALADYAAARRDELAAALIAGQASGVRCAALGVPDKEAYLDLAGLARQVARLLARQRPAAVLTHAYEGGHPDHDATAFAVHAACGCLAAGHRPAIIEMPFYHGENGNLIAGVFLPGPTEEVAVPLGKADLRRKHQMVGCFHTQREILSDLNLDPERFRPAPFYDFREPPHRGPLLYETFGWGITGADWRRHAAEALDAIGLSEPQWR